MKKLFISFLAVLFLLNITTDTNCTKKLRELIYSGWFTFPGSPPMKYQICGKWRKQLDPSNYILVEGLGKGLYTSEAWVQAREDAFNKMLIKADTLLGFHIKLTQNGRYKTLKSYLAEESIVLKERFAASYPMIQLMREKGDSIEVKIVFVIEKELLLEVVRHTLRKHLREKLKETDKELDELLRNLNE